ncbi:helix-turn-helix domain-containing protein [Uliginosibacterium gangwonense]|uniref:helix-turn-helix domain-containing protein n=1 Tax=Uliginosibacterium gangwonense TaxID=392736 RepID=UPI00035CF289|nr:helix-turn-helix domain-containing protein [Uliginosibacterium gangwonense]
MNALQYASRLQRLRRVATHIDTHLDQSLCLDELAEIAHLSRYHFERVFGAYAGETPLARVRRLRLSKALQTLAQGRAHALTALALASGYMSAAAFSRAFSRYYGFQPSAVVRIAPPPRSIRFEYLPAQAIQYVHYEGLHATDLTAFDELRAHAILADIPRSRRKGWSIQWQGRMADVENRAQGPDVLDAGLLDERLGQRIPGLYRQTLPGGYYAVLRLRGTYATPPQAELGRLINQDTGWSLTDGPMLRRFHNTGYLPADFERQCDLYIPVAR